MLAVTKCLILARHILTKICNSVTQCMNLICTYSKAYEATSMPRSELRMLDSEIILLGF
jgi:hypothetical protein